jgi:hypothetical protein
MICDLCRGYPVPSLRGQSSSPPNEGGTFRDFSAIDPDPMTIDFIKATNGRSVMLNLGTISPWMYRTEKPVEYPVRSESVTWDFEQGTS